MSQLSPREWISEFMFLPNDFGSLHNYGIWLTVCHPSIQTSNRWLSLAHMYSCSCISYCSCFQKGTRTKQNALWNAGYWKKLHMQRFKFWKIGVAAPATGPVFFGVSSSSWSRAMSTEQKNATPQAFVTHLELSEKSVVSQRISYCTKGTIG